MVSQQLGTQLSEMGKNPHWIRWKMEIEVALLLGFHEPTGIEATIPWMALGLSFFLCVFVFLSFQGMSMWTNL